MKSNLVNRALIPSNGGHQQVSFWHGSVAVPAASSDGVSPFEATWGGDALRTRRRGRTRYVRTRMAGRRRLIWALKTHTEKISFPPGLNHAFSFAAFNALSFQIVLGSPMVLYAKNLDATATVLGIISGMMPLLVIFQIPAAH
jgi:hypothetical protein